MTQPPRRNEKVVKWYTIILLRVVDVVEFSCIFIGFKSKSFEELRGVDGIRRISIDGTPRVQPFYSFIFLELEIHESSICSSAKIIIPRS